MKVVTSEIEVGALVVNLTPKCASIENEASKVAQAVEFEKEITLLQEDLVKEHQLKEGAISKSQHVVKKTF